MPDRIAVGYVSKTFFNMPLWIAEQHRFFADEDLEVAATMFGNASQVPPLLDGTLAVAIGSPEAGDAERRRGRPAADDRGQCRQARAFADRARAVQADRGFARRHHRHPHPEGGHVLSRCRTMLAAHGLHYPADYKVKDTGGVPPRHKALLAGEIDAGLQSVPWNYVAEDAGMNNLGDVIDYVPDWQFVSINANRDWAAAQPRRSLVRLPARDAARHRMALRQPRRRRRRSPRANCRRRCITPSAPGITSPARNALTRDMAVNEKGLAYVIATLEAGGAAGRRARRMRREFYIADEYLRQPKSG